MKRKVAIDLRFEFEFSHEDTSQDQRVIDELTNSIILTTQEQSLLYEVNGREYHTPLAVKGKN